MKVVLEFLRNNLKKKSLRLRPTKSKDVLINMHLPQPLPHETTLTKRKRKENLKFGNLKTTISIYPINSYRLSALCAMSGPPESPYISERMS